MSYSSANPYVRVHSDNLNGQNFFSVLECDAAIFEKSCLTYLHMRRMREGHSGIPGEAILNGGDHQNCELDGFPKTLRSI